MPCQAKTSQEIVLQSEHEASTRFACANTLIGGPAQLGLQVCVSESDKCAPTHGWKHSSGKHTTVSPVVMEATPHYFATTVCNSHFRLHDYMPQAQTKRPSHWVLP